MNRVSIQLKIFSGIAVILLISVSLSVVISVVNQRNALLETSQRDVRITNEILNAVIRNIMLDGEAPLAVSTIEDLQQVPGLDQLQIYRRDGRVAFSDFETLDFVNDFQTFMMFGRTPRQDDEEISLEAFQRTVESSTPQVVENIADRQLEFFFPIINTADCRVCHGSDHLVRGVAYYRVSLQRVFTEIDRGRNTLIIFFLGTGGFIALVLFSLMRRVVIAPVQSLGQVVQTVGQGNLDVQAEVRSRDEFGLLSQQINTMISGLKEKNRLELENSIIETRNRENQKYLDNIGEGLLLIDSERKISPQYSRFISELFGTDDIAGLGLDQFIYPDEHPDSDMRRELREFLDVIFESVQTEMDMIMSINPLKDLSLQVSSGEGTRRIIIDASFYRIMEGDRVENVMVIFTDRTNLVEVQEELERERQRSDAELEQIAAVLRIGPGSFSEFSADAHSVLERLERLESGSGGLDIEALARDLHSVKGTARYLNFLAIGESIHEVETHLPDAADAKLSAGFFPALDRFRRDLAGIEEIKTRFLSFSAASSQGDAAPGARESNVLEFRRAVQRMIGEIADQQEKRIAVKFRGSVRNLPDFRSLRPLLIHLVRNAVDHGLEERYERLAVGKDEEGRIEFIFSRTEDGGYKIIVADDGRGIDFDAVRARAERRGLIEEGKRLSRQDLVKILFSPGFSTRDSADELSGRGVGLDAVQAGIAEMGGRISVWTQEGKGTHFTILIPENFSGQSSGNDG
jgi:signal transduction histidine kinase/HAMP domain-containing protein